MSWQTCQNWAAARPVILPAAASRTFLAIGPATRPPVEPDSPSTFWTITATATLGCPPGGPANEMIQACDLAGGAELAGARLAANLCAGDLQARRGSVGDHSEHRPLEDLGVLGLTKRRHSPLSKLDTRSPSRARISLIT